MNTVALIPLLPGVGPTELIIILTIILLLFGAKKIPELAKGLGTGVREFKKGTSGADDKDDEVRGKDKNEAIVGGGDDEDVRPQDAREDGADLAAERAAKRTEQQ